MTTDAYQRYRYFNADGVLLYVGSTYRPIGREYDHARKSAWWPEVDHSRTLRDFYATRWECEEAERYTYFTDGPLHNKCVPHYHGVQTRAIRWRIPSPYDFRDENARMYERQRVRLGIELPPEPVKPKPPRPKWTPRYWPSVHTGTDDN